jgi:catechol-2,3-dioxygenase
MCLITGLWITEQIYHIAIVVSDINKAFEWYTENFDLEKGYKDETWALIRSRNLNIALVLKSEHLAHFAIEKDNAEEFGLLKTPRDGTLSTYISDPWGNIIEVIKNAV